ncbi:hypothetical protein DQM68_05915 [Leptospira mayottensis]|uniref:DUF1564 family protein n=1 Tax=Leptospira mayottensis TaxID=1137606 RepID=A0ABN5NWD1_9LEPT|nr:hypothetical protein DQM68_05915 [Leptospira mayottensis]AZQ03270.1 hypothetical protein LEP1GSC190_15765 [Leptospira mayottensis 200901116]AXR64077.1 hypothetical protein DQM28_07420 [Leptospira mayottensis]AXR64090.1 hypothetical protein DQM28_07500 [Leptospira mayottensis]AXR64103.1 hypothetical protein DQM28_07580 [Leptospira mayottensis]
MIKAGVVFFLLRGSREVVRKGSFRFLLLATRFSRQQRFRTHTRLIFETFFNQNEKLFHPHTFFL